MKKTIRSLKLETGKWALVLGETSPYWNGDVWRMEQIEAMEFGSDSAAKTYLSANLNRMEGAPQP